MANAIIFVVLLISGYFFGRMAESRHFKSIQAREKQYAQLLCFSERFVPDEVPPPHVDLVAGNVVISIDYFKRIAAGLRNLFGGRITAYESLIERARREAILRMKEDALDKGAHAIFNVKLETASIYKGRGQQIGSVEVYAYGTALIKKN
ncbi:MAG: YbjQ family protein [Methylococcales bacterium]|nr:YbjQ family protein [Methylococcales bacterium]